MKCECRPRQRLIIKRPTATTSSSGAVTESFVAVFTEYGYLEAKSPFELVQSEKVTGQLIYSIEVRWNPNTASITAKDRIVIVTLGNIELQVVGPISPLKGDRRKGLIKAVQGSPSLV